MKILTGFLLGLVATIGAAGLYVYSGTFNVAAVEPHSALEAWVLNIALERSVRARAQAITPPPMPRGQQIGQAFRLFDEMCTQCHGAPGKAPTMVGKGLNPPPPSLSKAAERWRRAELFWIVKNGIKMTGMPAFGPTHSDEDLWLLVAFLQRLPNIAPEEYNEMAEKFGQSGQSRQPQHKH